MVIGISLSFCGRDLMSGGVRIEDVEKIISSTKCSTEEDWEALIEQYKEVYWKKFSDQEIREMLSQVRPILEQPKLTGDRRPSYSRCGNRYWVEDERAIGWWDD